MERMLEEFIFVLRGAGVRVSVAEAIDAVRALEVTGYGDREALKHSLAATLAKTVPEKIIFESCFDSFFAPGDLLSREKHSFYPLAADTREKISPLSRMLLAGDNAGLMAAMREAFVAADFQGVQYYTQRGVYIRSVLTSMGLEAVDRDIAALRRENTSSTARAARILEEGRDRLTEQVKDLAARRFALYTGNMLKNGGEYLKDVRLTSLEHNDFKRIQWLIQKMVKRLVTVHGRRRHEFKRGLLDIKQTLRKNVAYQGYIVQPRLRRKKVTRPDVVAICDISRSVETVSRFMLLFLYGLNRVLSRIRTFVFCSNLVEASPVFERYPLERALSRVHAGTGLGVRFGLTDYGQALEDFKEHWMNAVTSRTTVIILGDARNNYGEHRADILAEIHQKCKKLIWLNPESHSFWGTGDSVMPRYLPYCHLARECNTVRHLEEVARELLTGTW